MPYYSITDLSPLIAPYSSICNILYPPTLINNTGIIIGSANTAQCSGSISGAYQGYALQPGSSAPPTQFGFLPYDVNDAGNVVGIGSGPTSVFQVSVYVGLPNDAQNATVYPQTGPRLQATAINNHDQAVGYFLNDITGEIGATLYSNGQVTLLGLLPGMSFSIAYGINDSGIIVGQTGLTNSNSRAVRYTNGAWQDLSAIVGTQSTASGINNTGQIIGRAVVASLSGSGNNQNGWVLDGNTKIDIPLTSALSAGATYAVDPRAINNFGIVIGVSSQTPPGTQVPFVYSSGQSYDLNALIDPNSGWTIIQAYDINDNGQIIAVALGPDNAQHGVRLDPTSANPFPRTGPGGAPVPSVSSIAPATGPVSTPVIVSGSNFGATQGTGVVNFGSAQATVSSWSDTRISVAAPAGSGQVSVTVTTAGGTSNGVSFTYQALTHPAIGVSPTSLDFGLITTNTAKDLVFMVTNIGSGTLIATASAAVPYSVVSGANIILEEGKSSNVIVRLFSATEGIFNQSLSIAGNVSSDPLPLKGVVATPASYAPKITGITPDVSQGKSVLIEGRNLGSAPGKVTVSGVPATNIPLWSNNLIQFVLPAVPVGSASVVVTAATNVSTSAVKLNVLGSGPFIDDTNLPSTTAGSMYVLTGTNFGGQPQLGPSSLTFGPGVNREPVNIIRWSDTHIAFTVPATALKGNNYVTVTTIIGSTSTGPVSSNTTAIVRVRDVAAITTYGQCETLLGLQLTDTCPPLIVTTSPGINGTVDIQIENNTSRWYSLSINPEGGAIVPGAVITTLAGSSIVPTSLLVVIGPHGKYTFPGVTLPQVGSVSFLVDATTDLAKVAFMLDYGSAAICLWELVGGCPRLPADLGALEPFLGVLAGDLAPKFVEVELKLYHAFVSGSASDFLGAINGLVALLNTDPVIYAQFKKLGFSAGTLTDMASSTAFLNNAWKAFDLSANASLAVNDPTSGSALVVGR